MIRLPPIWPRIDPLLPYTRLFRSSRCRAGASSCRGKRPPNSMRLWLRSSKGPPPPPDDRQGGRMARSTTGLFRTRGEHGHAPVTYIELFFDLVFVFAIDRQSVV